MNTEQTSIKLEDYYKNDKIRMDVVKAKYLKHPEQTIDDFFGYLSSEIADVSVENNKDLWFPKWKTQFIDGKWRPGGSIISSVNQKEKKVSTANCTTFLIEEDTLKSIYKTRYEAAQAAAHRQGIGIEFSNVRPRGSKVSNSAEVSEGAINWMKSINNLALEVGQRGRVPAILGSLKIHHMDIEEFIIVKSDLNTLNNMNISVQISDNFMSTLKKGGDWELYFEFDNGERISKIVNSEKLFDLICHQSYLHAEPGLQFIDLMKRFSIQEALGYEISSTNACVPDFATVLTPNGIREFYEINKNDIIWSGKQWTKIVDKWSNGVKPVYEYITTAGRFIGTEDHKVFKRGQKYSISELNSIDIVTGEVKQSEIIQQAVLDGLIIGDGSVHKASKNLVYLNIGEKDIDYFTDKVSSFITKKRTDAFKCGYEVITTITSEELPNTYKRVVPERYFKGDYNTVCSFLRGIFSANGYVVDGRICLKQTSYELILQIQQMLSFVGISSYYTTNKEKFNKFSNGVYVSKESYDINITKNKDIFYKNIGFIQLYKQTKLKEFVDDYNSNYHYKETFEITNIKELGNFEVFDITVDCDSHSFWNNCCHVSNCSEKPLPNYGVCVLASMNMAEVPSLTNKDEFKLFMSDLVYSMVRYMDNVVQYEIDNSYKSPLKEQLKVVSDLREIGLGVTNLHQWMYNNGVAYDSDEGADLAEEFFKWYQYYAFKSSCELAIERGPAPAWQKCKDNNTLKETEFLKHLFNKFPDLKEMFYKTGIRNGALLSIAPAGSLSFTFPEDCLSTGIEPTIGYAYWRKTRAISKNEYDYYFVLPTSIKNIILNKMNQDRSKVTIDDYEIINNFQGSALDTDGEIGKKIIDIIKKWTDIDLLKPANDIDPFKKIKMMGRVQKWIDAAISVTYNLPSDFPEEKIKELYMSAYDEKIKALSIYRDGSREGILIFEDPVTHRAKYYKDNKSVIRCLTDNRPTDIQYQCAPKRPKNLPCEIHHCAVKGEQWIVLVGMLNGNPYEVFAGKKNEDFNIAKSVKDGIVIKNNGTYTLRIPSKSTYIEYNDVTQLFMNEEFKALTRMISLSLRHGVYHEFIVSQLKKSSEFVGDFMAVVSRVLNKYIKETIILDNKNTCPDCGEGLINESGCVKCSNCTYSKCG